jgi:hypothetical protein
MDLVEYFANSRGLGVLSTADGDGRVNAALYSRPRFVDKATIQFIMADRRSRRNLAVNPLASYLYREENGSGGYRGTRLYLTKVDEKADPDLVAKLRAERGFPGVRDYKNEGKAVVSFRIDEVRPLVGDDGEEDA